MTESQLNSRIDRFREILASVADDISEAAITAAHLGNLIRRRHPAFSPADFGYEKLTELLRAVPDVGTLEPGANGHPYFRPREGWGARATLRSDIWRAATDFTRPGGGALLDLSSLCVATQSDGDDVQEQPERFLPIPDAGEGFQKGLALEFARREGGEELAARVTEAFGEPGWLQRVRAMFTSAGLAQRWDDARQRGVAGLVLDWADRHGIPRSRLTKSPPESPRSIVAPSAGGEAAAARLALHALIDRLTDGEVLAFPVPAAFLPRLQAGSPTRPHTR